MKRLAALPFVLWAMAPASPSLAQPAAGPAGFPSRNIVIVVPYPPGGSIDILARAVAEGLSPLVPQPVIVENRSGAGGTVGAAYVAKAAPDGYTLLLCDLGPLVMAKTTVPNLPYDTLRDFVGVSLAVDTTISMTVRPRLPARSVSEFVKMAADNPGKFTYSSAGVASSTHVAGALLESIAGIKLNHIPYRGGAPALLAVVSEEVDVSFTPLNTTLPYMKDGKVRSLGVSTGTGARSRLAPEIPTIAEQGVTGYRISLWQGIVAPAATPKPIVDYLSAKIAETLNSPAVSARLSGLGYEIIAEGSDKFNVYLRDEAKRWDAALRAANIKAE